MNGLVYTEEQHHYCNGFGELKEPLCVRNESPFRYTWCPRIDSRSDDPAVDGVKNEAHD